ncbi:MAG TPA: hypothetical protein VD902_00815 [Symbiobacteriaceae bacterium]|nr:hypothetical protein [Symbiobacteriaceae bacterium]
MKITIEMSPSTFISVVLILATFALAAIRQAVADQDNILSGRRSQKWDGGVASQALVTRAPALILSQRGRP